MPFDSLYSLVNDNIFRFQVPRIVKDPLRTQLQTHRDTFRMTCDTYVEIPNSFRDIRDLTLMISETTEFSEGRSERATSIAYFKRSSEAFGQLTTLRIR
jgi:hypothetical protein